MLHNANQVLKVEEEFDSPQYKDALGGNLGVFFKQGKDPGESPCWPLYLQNYDPTDSEAGVGTCLEDYLNQIKR